ncbi:alpha/beta fold hydrolase [Noviherbaspirillum saxi]|uniref:Alpha/beta hydrolase n=1 Tax=Noviherbaspirillum saxi TaxID=2320863 RepID=A0A3A3FLT3_9BURK|nr:alpha/beta hydrolase [Noviherbaspirillum saxi]RJF95435.1 alpha/beta hydrolase [Noviherbaspirillum saxi]
MHNTILSGQFAALPNGMRLHYASAGTPGKPLLLFVHGFPEFWYEWEAQLHHFARDYFAVAPDLRGFNLSSMPDALESYKAKHIVEDLRLFAEHLGYSQFVMVAHDWGGAISWNFAISHPQYLHKLININSPHPYLFWKALMNDSAQRAASEYMNWLRAKGSETVLARNDFALLEAFMNAKGRTPTPWFTAEVRRQYHACWARGLTGAVNYYRASPLHPPTGDHPGPLKFNLAAEDFRIRIPVRVIWGESDVALLTPLIEGIEDLIDDVIVERIPEGSHWLVHEQPDRINRLIQGFLDQ